MKVKFVPFLFMLLILAIWVFNPSGQAQETQNNSQNKDFRGPYLGQKPPGMTPEIFAPRIISEAGYQLHSFPAISPDGCEIYWAVIPPKIMFMKQIAGVWTKPEVAPFTEKNIQAPVFPPDGNRLYFQITRETGFGSLDIWYVERTDNGWSDPKNLGTPPNSEKMEAQPSFTSDGTMYFTGSLEGVLWDRGIYRSRLRSIDGKYSIPELLNKPINTEFIDAYPFIAPDESFLLFSSSRPDRQEEDLKLFISFRDEMGNWSEPINLSAKLGVQSSIRFGCLSPDGKYLFYMSCEKIYWVDAKIIQK